MLTASKFTLSVSLALPPPPQLPGEVVQLRLLVFRLPLETRSLVRSNGPTRTTLLRCPASLSRLWSRLARLHWPPRPLLLPRSHHSPGCESSQLLFLLYFDSDYFRETVIPGTKSPASGLTLPLSRPVVSATSLPPLSSMTCPIVIALHCLPTESFLLPTVVPLCTGGTSTPSAPSLWTTPISLSSWLLSPIHSPTRLPTCTSPSALALLLPTRN